MDHEVVVCRDGQEAWQSLQTEGAPRSAILDLMPKMDGLLVCKEIRPGRTLCPLPAPHTKSQKEDLITGLEAGKDDHLTKPKALTETASNSP